WGLHSLQSGNCFIGKPSCGMTIRQGFKQSRSVRTCNGFQKFDGTEFAKILRAHFAALEYGDKLGNAPMLFQREVLFEASSHGRLALGQNLQQPVRGALARFVYLASEVCDQQIDFVAWDVLCGLELVLQKRNDLLSWTCK